MFPSSKLTICGSLRDIPDKQIAPDHDIKGYLEEGSERLTVFRYLFIIYHNVASQYILKLLTG
jgi:hypothetical protein